MNKTNKLLDALESAINFILNYLSLQLPTQVQTPVPQQTERAKPHCKKCGNPMKGHAKVTDCPRNQK